MEDLFETFGPFIVMIGIVLLIILLVKINKAKKHARSVCPQCKKEYSYPESFDITAGPLRWVKRTKEVRKGDFDYEVEYKVFIRDVFIELKCTSCGHTHSISKPVEVWRSDSNRSQSDAEELAVIRSAVRSAFDASMFVGKEIEIFVINE